MREEAAADTQLKHSTLAERAGRTWRGTRNRASTSADPAERTWMDFTDRWAATRPVVAAGHMIQREAGAHPRCRPSDGSEAAGGRGGKMATYLPRDYQPAGANSATRPKTPYSQS